MKLSELLLRKEELPILGKEPRHTWFTMPIHPLLLRDDVVLDDCLAPSLFQQAALE